MQRRPRRTWPLSQPPPEEFDDALARLVGGMPLHLADLERQHRMRRLAEPVLVALLRVQLDDLEAIAKPLLERLEARAGRQGVLTEPQSECAQPLIGDAPFDDLQLGFRQPRIAFLP